MNKGARFHKIVQAVKMLNSIARAGFNFRRRPILCSAIETLCKRATSVAHLTNFFLRIFKKISEKWPLNVFLTMVQKTNDQNSSQRQARSGIAQSAQKNHLELTNLRKKKRNRIKKKTAVPMRVLCPPPSSCAHMYKYTR